ncbi:MAG: hypothetical protein B7Y80_18835 [Hyphomicrobium sp. 32-62-53]|nr:MAG: hypothetical protein B7Z29_17520 [Hyphomicrobium sp. 12-62-95]OYX97674.1 MAG: hypothetical protein B7Y80_18835 [Hyphomicrobium sp. 32-62-53]
MLPDCFECKYGEMGHPCRLRDGAFDFAKVAAAIIGVARAYQAADAAGGEAVVGDSIAWVTDCEYEAIEDHPQLLLPLIVAAMDACETPADASFVAAGLIENAVVKHGPVLIDRLEALAVASPKASYILSGIWSQRGSVDEAVWARIGRAVAKHPRMSSDGRGPHDGGTVTVLDEVAAAVLMQERVSETARAISL